MGLVRMAYRAGDAKFSRRLLDAESPKDGEVLYVGAASDSLVWDAEKLEFRLPTAEELQAEKSAEQAKLTETATARDDAKRALGALDTIIGGIDAATLAQAKMAIKQEAQILRHLILATVGR